MKTFTKLLTIPTLIASMLSPSAGIAAEEGRNESPENIRDGLYLDIGIGLRYQSDPFIFDNEYDSSLFTFDNRDDSGLDIFINARYQKYGFFVEFPHGTSKQQNTVMSFGYNFLNTEHWSYDYRLAMNHREFQYKLPKSNIVSRRTSRINHGLRILGDYGNTHIKFIVAGASGPNGLVSTANGLYVSSWLSQNYHYSNWSFYTTVGIEYRNEDVVNHFYGAVEGEFPGSNEIDGLPSYQGKSGFEYTAQVGFDYPITTDWVFEGFVRSILLPSGITDSPLVDGNTVTETAVLIKYVF